MSNPDIHLPEKLEAEASGLLNWIIAGAQMYYAGALEDHNVPASVKEATAALWGKVDTLAEWLTVDCVLDPHSETDRDRLMDLYVAWCERTHQAYPVGRNKLFAYLRRTPGLKERKTNGRYPIQGIRPKSPAERQMVGIDSTDQAAFDDEPVPIDRKPPASDIEPVSPPRKKRSIIQ